MLKLMDKKILTILHSKCLFILTYVKYCQIKTQAPTACEFHDWKMDVCFLTMVSTATMQSLYNAMFRSIEMDRLLSELCYRGTILQENYRKMKFGHFMAIFLCI